MHRLSLFCLALLLMGLAACAENETAEDASTAPASNEGRAETVPIILDEYGYELPRDTFVTGRPYRFLLINEGEIPHEWVLVPRGAEDEGAGVIEIPQDRLMPGDTVEVMYTFLRPGSYDMACYIEGAPGTDASNHYTAGMITPIEVHRPDR